MATTGTHGTLGRIGLLASAALMALTAATMVALPAAAADVERATRGACSGRGDWELELEKEDGRIEVRVEVHGDRAGRQWRIRTYRNGELTTNVLRTANVRGRLAIEWTRRDRAGVDTFRFRAVDQVSGQVCAGSLSI